MLCLFPAFRYVPTVIKSVCWLTAWGTVLIVFAPSLSSICALLRWAGRRRRVYLLCITRLTAH